jgi:type IV secretory pathway VirJ component
VIKNKLIKIIFKMFYQIPFRLLLALSVLIFMNFSSAAIAQSKNTGALPIHVLESSGSEKPFILYISGDGGWNNFSQELCAELNKQNYSVVALDSKKYFWDGTTPEDFIHAAQQLITFYQEKWNKKEFALVGYSFGADVSAFLASGLNASFLKHLRPVVLLSPASSTDFAIHLSDMLSSADVNRKYNVSTALTRSAVPVVCVFGQDEQVQLKKNFPENELVKMKIIDGSHRFNNDVKGLRQVIAEIIGK